ncbi:hypothetical protein PFISCL1PPCAC_4922, partial [Pristionchus fissidentatus]
SASPEETTALKNGADTYRETPAPSRTLRLSLKRLLMLSIALLTLLVLSSLITALIFNMFYRNTCTSDACVSASDALRRNA